MRHFPREIQTFSNSTILNFPPPNGNTAPTKLNFKKITFLYFLFKWNIFKWQENSFILKFSFFWIYRHWMATPHCPGFYQLRTSTIRDWFASGDPVRSRSKCVHPHDPSGRKIPFLPVLGTGSGRCRGKCGVGRRPSFRRAGRCPPSCRMWQRWTSAGPACPSQSVWIWARKRRCTQRRGASKSGRTGRSLCPTADKYRPPILLI